MVLVVSCWKWVLPYGSRFCPDQQQLLEKFRRNNDFHLWLKRFKLYAQQNEFTTENWVKKLVPLLENESFCLLHRLGLLESAEYNAVIRNQFIQAIQSSSIQLLLLKEQPDTLDCALILARRNRSSWQYCQGRYASDPQHKVPLAAATQFYRQTTIPCWQCDKQGYICRNCTNTYTMSLGNSTLVSINTIHSPVTNDGKVQGHTTTMLHCKNIIVNITNVFISTAARNSKL